MNPTLNPIFRFLSELEAGDIIDYYDLDKFGQTIVKHARIISINTDKENYNLTINVGGQEIQVNPENRWDRIFVSQIICTNLAELGFVPVKSKPAYGKTASKWVLEKQDKIWTLSHEEGMSWTLELKVKGTNEIVPIQISNNLIYIHQIQHFIKNSDAI